MNASTKHFIRRPRGVRPQGRRRIERMLRVFLASCGISAVFAYTLEVKDKADLTFAAGAEFRTAPLAKSGGTGALIRSGGPGDHSVIVAVKPAPQPIKRLQLELEFLIGYESQSGNAPVLSIWTHTTPDSTAAGGKQIYESPPLRCDEKDKHHCYTTCDEKDQRDCYLPSLSVDATCADCTGTYVSLHFTNNANNVQVLLPLTFNLNEETRFVSYIVDFSALIVALCKLLYLYLCSCRCTHCIETVYIGDDAGYRDRYGDWSNCLREAREARLASHSARGPRSIPRRLGARWCPILNLGVSKLYCAGPTPTARPPDKCCTLRERHECCSQR